VKPSAAGANLPALRSHNAALVLDLLRAAGRRAAAAAGDGALSRLELATRTGLTPQAVSKITARLREEGLVEEAGRRASTGGKPSTSLRLAAGARYAVGVHLDGEALTAVLADLSGRTVVHRSVPLDLGQPVPDGLAAIVREIRATLALAPGPVLGAGIGMRGPLDHTTGTLHRVTGYPHWSGTPLRAELADRLGLPVTVDKNTNAAALALLAVPPPDVPGACTGAGGALSGAGERSGPGAAGGPGRPDHRGAANGSYGSYGSDTSPGTSLRALLGTSSGTSSVPPGPGTPAGPGGPGGTSGGVGPAGSFGYLHLGAGLGAGLVLAGKLYRGGRTGAGEFGHQAVALDGPVCACGNRGCLEALCLAAVGRGDLVAAARLLGVGAANLVALLDIERVVLGGRTALAAPGLFQREVAAVLAERGRIVPVSTASPLAVAEGAALLALAPLFSTGSLA